MGGYKTLDVSIFSFVILTLIFFDAYNRIEKPFLHYKIFMHLLISNAFITVTDLLSWVFDGKPGVLNQLMNAGMNTMLYIFISYFYVLWVAFVHSLVFQAQKTSKKLTSVLTVFLILQCMMSISSIFTGWYFYIDAANVYHRGPLFSLYVTTTCLLFVYSLMLTYLNRRRILKRYLHLMFLFAIPQIIGCLMQVLFIGVSLGATGVTVSLLIVYFNMQSRSISQDHLTGLDNRRHMEGYLAQRIKKSIKHKRRFSAILLDLNSFKRINDTFGHDTGDEALKNAADILKRCMKSNNIIARYGGDEFFMILDVSTKSDLEQAVRDIRESAMRFNSEHNKLYSLSFSMGYDVYDYRIPMEPQDFIRHLDALMYKEKLARAKKLAQS